VLAALEGSMVPIKTINFHLASEGREHIKRQGMVDSKQEAAS
jgi:hypothetical protein